MIETLTLSQAGVPWHVIQGLSDAMRTAMYIVVIELKGEHRFDYRGWSWIKREG